MKYGNKGYEHTPYYFLSHYNSIADNCATDCILQSRKKI